MKVVHVMVAGLVVGAIGCGTAPAGPDAGLGIAPDASAIGADSGTLTADSGVKVDAGQTGTIPDPGTSDAVDQNWGSVGNNSTPAQATPLGTALQGNISTWVNGNTIGGTDTANYFVFRSGPAAGQLSFDICFSAPITSMTATLWTVIGGVAQMPPVGTWNSSATCVQNTGTDAPLAPSTVYLFEVTAAGGSGSYTS